MKRPAVSPASLLQKVLFQDWNFRTWRCSHFMGERTKSALDGRQGVGRGTHNRLSFYALFLNPPPLNHNMNLAFLHFTLHPSKVTRHSIVSRPDEVERYECHRLKKSCNARSLVTFTFLTNPCSSRPKNPCKTLL